MMTIEDIVRSLETSAGFTAEFSNHINNRALLPTELNAYNALLDLAQSCSIALQLYMDQNVIGPLSKGQDDTRGEDTE